MDVATRSICCWLSSAKIGRLRTSANTGTGKDTNHAVSPSGGAMLELAENTGVDIIQ